ncbi:ABC transporter substrate-binding protein [Falsiroseomonas sp. HW251]|uniref:ABC transporter substrate-binding protein n=1 Tax=Falsiroseomonas sp. HW251 TaxID=3390998 RepID=UPI003D317521
MTKPIPPAPFGRRAMLVAAVAMLPAPSIAQGAGQTIRIAVVRATVLAPALLVQQFLPAGWRTDLTPFVAPGDMSNALLTDSVDLAYIGLTIGIVARSREQPISIVANGAGKGTAIIVRADSDIRSIADLRGKRVGNIPLAIHEILLREELRKANMRIQDINLIRLGPADMPGALQRGEIDAFAGNEPNATLAVMGGYGRVLMFPYDNPVGTINVGVLSSDRVTSQRQELMRAWAEAHAKATDRLAADPEGWADLVAREWGYDRTATRRSIDNIELGWRIDARFESQLGAYIDRLQELGVITRKPDMSKLLVKSFVEGVRV